ncbi:IS3 family transposase [Umezawaea sp. Da 62-37]|uniref:IS3 family transposase n=1 Tax=Umezawaea sp. Da 62-37 TaxID=3075927 RepID=UPI0037DDC56B
MSTADLRADDDPMGKKKQGPRAGQPKRRTFTAAYKLAIVEEYESLTEPGAKGALLRREGLYHSHLIDWTRSRDAGGLDALAAKPSGPKGRSAAEKETDRLRADNERLARELAKSQAVVEIMKTARALGNDLRGHGHRPQVDKLIGNAFDELEPLLGTKPGCALVGKSRATLYRRRNPTPPVAGPHRPPAPHPASLSAAERAQVLDVLRSPRFVDKAPAQVWATLLDEGRYLCSISTMYRLLRQAGEVRERRAQATHPAKVKPELVATAPDMVWSWDITKLKGPDRGVYYDLFVMLDIYSRKVVHAMVASTETAELAARFITDAIAANGGTIPGVVHADRGTSMTSKNVAMLLADLGVTRSHSRPHVSDDNPYSEAQFKTLKYCPAFPGRFGSIADARAFSHRFFQYYNHEHRHSGIGLHTPASVHDGTAATVCAERARVLHAAYTANPDRFHRVPTPPRLPAAAWINEPPQEDEKAEHDPEQAS